MCTKCKFSTRPDPNLNFSSPTRPDDFSIRPDPTTFQPDPTGFQPDPTRPDIFTSFNFVEIFHFGSWKACHCEPIFNLFTGYQL